MDFIAYLFEGRLEADMKSFSKRLDLVLTKLTRMEHNMATIDNLNAAIAAEATTEATTLTGLASLMKTDTDALLAKIAAGAAPADFQAQVDAVNANNAALIAIAATLSGVDAEVNPPGGSTPPGTGSTPSS